MKKLPVWLVSAAIILLTLVATAGAASACNYIFHEPPVPAKLRK